MCNDCEPKKEVKVVEENDGAILAEGEPKTITFEIGINGTPKLDIRCDKEMTEYDVCLALAGIDLLMFNQKYKQENHIWEDWVRFNTMKKEIFLQYVLKLYGEEEGQKLIDQLVDII